MAQEYPSVAIIGAGPTGLVLANLLGQYGVQTLLIERNPDLLDEARAVSIDDESLRTLQAIGLIDTVLPEIVQGYGVDYYSWTNHLFASITPTSTEYGFPKRNAFRQPVLARQLLKGLERFPHVSVLFEHELQRVTQYEDTVLMQIFHQGKIKSLRCHWLVACDGARSPVREQLDIALQGSSYAQPWLIVDLLERSTAFRHTRTYCDPKRPTIRRPGPQGSVRYEFMLHPGEDPKRMQDETLVRRWIAEREPADARLGIARNVVYTFHARVAERWRQDRVFLAGDAAHLSPPFAGQGMNSGVRDAVNLAWKLAAVVQGRLASSVLDSYEVERQPHARAMIQMAERIGAFLQPQSRLGAMLSQGLLKLISLYTPARDYVMQLKFKPLPRFTEGCFIPAPARALLPTGQLLPQPWVELRSGKRVRLDDVLGSGFALLRWASSPAPAALADFPVRDVQLLAQSDDFLLERARNPKVIVVRDCEGVLGPLLQSAGAEAMLLRPDRYVMAYLPRSAMLKNLSAVKHPFFKLRNSS